jgi:undecaprenyl-diphosphatase
VVNTSFPSVHAMLSAVFYLTLALLLARVQTQKRIKIYVVAVAAVTPGLVGVTRIYLASTGPPTCWPAGALERLGQ